MDSDFDFDFAMAQRDLAPLDLSRKPTVQTPASSTSSLFPVQSPAWFSPSICWPTNGFGGLAGANAVGNPWMSLFPHLLYLQPGITKFAKFNQFSV